MTQVMVNGEWVNAYDADPVYADLFSYYGLVPPSEYALRIFRGGRGHGKRAILEAIRERLITGRVSPTKVNGVPTLDPKAVKWRVPSPSLLTDRRGIALTQAILDRHRRHHGTGNR